MYIHVYIYIYFYAHIYIYMCICIYIYIDRTKLILKQYWFGNIEISGHQLQYLATSLFLHMFYAIVGFYNNSSFTMSFQQNAFDKMFPYGGFLKQGYPRSINVHDIFQYKPGIFGAPPSFQKTSMRKNDDQRHPAKTKVGEVEVTIEISRNHYQRISNMDKNSYIIYIYIYTS